MSISGFYVRLGYRLSLPKWKTVVRKLLNILCKTDIKISYITLRESCGLDAELLAFHIGAGIMISLWLQKVCRYSFMPLVVYLFTWRSILITWLSYNSRPALSRNGVFIFNFFCPQSDAIRSDHSLTRNAPKLTYSNLRFQEFHRGRNPRNFVKRGNG